MKKNIAVIMGGYSSEVAISLNSGSIVYKHLNRTKYTPYCIHILKEKWVYIDDDDNEFPIDKNDFSIRVQNEKIVFDCVFNAIHGTPGEDGRLLAYLELIGMKHTSAPSYQMALTFNKRDTLSVVRQYGIQTAKSIYLNKGDVIDTSKIIDTLGVPCFIKPNNAGSSFGITKAYNADEIILGIEKAYQEDSAILLESFLEGTEVSVGVIEYKGNIEVLPITEITSENDFFDYEAKYEGKSEEITPARISEIEVKKVSEIAKKVYHVLDMRGFSRSEFIFVNGEPHFLEINTVPGLTAESILPQQANQANISLSDLFDNAITLALNR